MNHNLNKIDYGIEPNSEYEEEEGEDLTVFFNDINDSEYVYDLIKDLCKDSICPIFDLLSKDEVIEFLYIDTYIQMETYINGID